MLSLKDLKPGQSARVLKIKGDADLQEGLASLGLSLSAVVDLAYQAPFGGDPLALRVRGSLVAIRRQQASQIEVELL